MASPTIKLSSGHEMPQVGFGLWKVKSGETVYQAIKAGYRLLDGACDYGNEVECGQAVARAIKEGIVKRSDLFIVTKIWPTFYDGERVEPICRRQLADWGVDYFDLYLMHFPIPLAYVDPEVRYPPGWKYDGKSEVRRGKATLQETWAAMEGLVSAGLTRSIGVSNFQAQLMYSLLANARIKPATLQVELHPYLTQVPLVRLCREEGIAVTAYSSFGSSGFMEITSPNMAKMKEVEPLWDLPAITEIAAKHKKEPSQVLLRWATQRGIAVIPKTNRPNMMGVNLDCTGWDLSEEDLETISGLNKNLRFNQPTNYFDSEKLWLFA